MIPLLQEYRAKYPSLLLYLRGDSGFASPDLYTRLAKITTVSMQSA